MPNDNLCFALHPIPNIRQPDVQLVNGMKRGEISEAKGVKLGSKPLIIKRETDKSTEPINPTRSSIGKNSTYNTCVVYRTLNTISCRELYRSILANH